MKIVFFVAILLSLSMGSRLQQRLNPRYLQEEVAPVEIQTFDDPEFRTEVGDLNEVKDSDEPTTDILDATQIPEEPKEVEIEEPQFAPQVRPAPVPVAPIAPRPQPIAR